MRLAPALAVALLLAGCAVSPVEAPAQDGWPPLSTDAISPRTEGVALIEIEARYAVRGANGSWVAAPDAWTGVHPCSDGFYRDPMVWAVNASGTNLSGGVPVAIVELSPSLDPSAVKWERHVLPTTLPYTHKLARFEIDVTADGVHVGAEPIEPGSFAVRIEQNATDRISYRIAHLGLWVPPAGNHVEYGCD